MTGAARQQPVVRCSAKPWPSGHRASAREHPRQRAPAPVASTRSCGADAGNGPSPGAGWWSAARAGLGATNPRGLGLTRAAGTSPARCPRPIAIRSSTPVQSETPIANNARRCPQTVDRGSRASRPSTPYTRGKGAKRTFGGSTMAARLPRASGRQARVPRRPVETTRSALVRSSGRVVRESTLTSSMLSARASSPLFVGGVTIPNSRAARACSTGSEEGWSLDCGDKIC